jgi:hypothetical protein
VSPGSIFTGIRSRFFALAGFVLGINVAVGKLGGRGKREIGSRALLAGRTGEAWRVDQWTGQGHRVWGGKLPGDNVKLE